DRPMPSVSPYYVEIHKDPTALPPRRGAVHGPQLAAFLPPSGSDADVLLTAAAALARQHGLHVGGVIQVAVTPGKGCESGLLLEDLATGVQREIWQYRGPGARGCRLDQSALAESVVQVEQAVAAGVDLLIVNRFGASESLGKGMVPALVAALDAGVPVLTCVRAPYVDAWAAFHGGMATQLAPTTAEISHWVAGLAQSAAQARG
ncbi:MAG: DUF2478 domain-containing protein, partial [Pseudomonadota bacterium]